MNDPSSYSGEERRWFSRVKAQFEVTYKIDKSVELRMLVRRFFWNKEIKAKMIDLSSGGMAILTDYFIPASTSILAKFILINLNVDGDQRIKPMDIIGKVRYSTAINEKTYRLGIIFTKISIEDKYIIDGFVRTVFKR